MNKLKKKIYVIYTGGTIGMQKSSQGYIPQPGLLTRLMQTMPEFSHQDMPHFTINEYQPLIDSANMQPSHWQQIANDIRDHYDEYDGFVVLHGTDTMAYTASALSFMIDNLSKPIIITGSQVPLIEVHTDARENLILSLMIAAHEPIPEVCIYFNDTLMRGNRTQKVNAFSFAAFGSPNFPALAKVGVTIKLRQELVLAMPAPPASLFVHILKPVKIAQFSLFPGMELSVLEQIILLKPQALILHTYGVGNVPASDNHFINLIANAIKNPTLVINHTQCFKGSVEMESYATGGILQQLGVVSAYNMTTEAIIGKLTVLLSQDLSYDDLKMAFLKNSKGEM